MDWVEDLHQAGVRRGQIKNCLAQSVTGVLYTLLTKQMPSTENDDVEAHLTQVLPVDLAAN